MMSHPLLARFALLTTFFVLSAVPGLSQERQTTPSEVKRPNPNLVYVKIIWPTERSPHDNRPVVESWIAKQLEKHGQHKSVAATAWVPLAAVGDEKTRVWDGNLGNKTRACPVAGEIVERADGRIKVLLDGWSPAYAKVAVTLIDESGSRKIAAVKELKDDGGSPYVAVLIGPPSE